MIDKIVRSKRKTLSLHIDGSGEVVVRAPLRMPQSFIDRFVNGKSAWIEKHKNKVRRRLEENPPRRFIPGEKFHFFGEEYELEFRDKTGRALVLEGNFITRPAAAEEIKKRFRKWYRDEARFFLAERLTICAEQYHLPYKELKVTSAAHRWGSCTSKGSVNFPWRIMMCPEPVIAYIIAHEMAHLRHLNHSVSFWREVEKMCPTYRDDRKWLRANEHKFEGF